MTRVRDLLGDRSEIYSLSDEATVHDAARYLRKHQVRATGVCDVSGRLVGVIAQSDISDKVAAEHKCPSWIKVREVMSTHLVTVNPETNLEECVRLMEKHKIYHLLVVDGGANLGMISAQDVLRLVARDEKARADLLESWAFPLESKATGG
jgi:predicted transcriptional regulator